MVVLELLFYKNILKILCFIIIGNLILGIFCLLLVLMGFSKLIGIKRDISELHHLILVLEEARIFLFILLMMLFKKIVEIMVDLRKETR